MVRHVELRPMGRRYKELNLANVLAPYRAATGGVARRALPFMNWHNLAKNKSHL